MLLGAALATLLTAAAARADAGLAPSPDGSTLLSPVQAPPAHSSLGPAAANPLLQPEAALPSLQPAVPRPAHPPTAEPAPETVAATVSLPVSEPSALPPLLRDRRVLPAAEVAGLQLVMMTWSREVGRAHWADVTPTSIRRNLGSGWVFDDDAYFVNQAGHPYQGTFAFTAARSAGQGFWASTLYPIAASAAWELAGETERPSLNDQITTSVGGVVLGEILFRLSDWVRGDGRSGWRLVPATLLSPMSGVNRGLGMGGAPERPAAARLQLEVGALAAPGAIAGGADGRLLARPAPRWGLRLREGTPGYEDAPFERPFDHFDVKVAVAATDQTYLTVRARGLVLGAELGGAGQPGAALWGLWLGYDLDGPGARRASTATAGLGITGRQALAGGLELEGTAIGSAVLLGAVGLVAKPAGSDRDYRMGPGAQSLLELALDARRLRVELEARHLLVVGAGGQGGHDQLLDGTAAAQVGLFGKHALRLEAGRFLRLATERDGASQRQTGTVVALSWVWRDGPGQARIASL